MNKGALCISLVLFSSCSTIVPLEIKHLNQNILQAILVQPLAVKSHQASLTTWQKEQGVWHRLHRVSAVLGRNGLADEGHKKEGDGKTPSGIYPLDFAFGYSPRINTGLTYRQATDLDFWVDDVKSVQYNQWVHGKPQANSFERMKRADRLYQYGIVIGYNTSPVLLGAGSAIFMHVWRRYDASTAGCVAINQMNMRKILKWLNRHDHPVILLTRKQ